MPRPDPIEDVIEACADALLTACAASLSQPPDVGEAWERALKACASVVERTWREGPRPR